MTENDTILTRLPSLEEIASCVSGYDPNALPVAQAQDFIARFVPRLDAEVVERVPLRSALGRVLARDMVSPISVPTHDNSAMDGYALRSGTRSTVSVSSRGTKRAMKPCACATGSAFGS